MLQVMRHVLTNFSIELLLYLILLDSVSSMSVFCAQSLMILKEYITLLFIFKIISTKIVHV